MGVRLCLCTVCGIPASGKSTFCGRLSQDLVNDFIVIFINYDDILLSQNTDEIQLHESLLHHSQNQAEDGILKGPRHQMICLVEILIQHINKHGPQFPAEMIDGMDRINKDIQQSFLSGCKKHLSSTSSEHPRDVLILIDDNFYFSSMRYDFYKLARRYETGFCEIFMDSSIERALQRNKMRNGREIVSDDVIQNMALKLEPPDPVKNPWERYSMTVNTEEWTSGVIAMIKEALANPAQPAPQVDEREQAQSRTVCSKSLIHQVDLILRQCVTSAIAKGKQSSKDVKLLGKQLMAAKEDILTGLKSGLFNIPFDETSTIVNASKDENCDLFKYVYSLFTERLKDY